MKLKDKKKLIVIKSSGNHSNRLQQNLHFEAFCMEHQIEFHNPTFGEMASYYTEPCNTESTPFLKFLQIDILGKLFHHSRVIKKIFSIVWIVSKLNLLKLIRFDKRSKEAETEALLLKSFEKNDVIYVGGWKFNFTELTKKHWDEMSMKYSLKETHTENNELVNKINTLKLEAHSLIGVHIRRGDYKKWKGGKYYYDDSVYKKQMDNIALQLSKQGNERHIFVIFSNDVVGFEPSNNIIISKEDWYIDQHIMTLCDYLIGPPSTFTLWASYIGQVKLFHLYDSNENIIL